MSLRSQNRQRLFAHQQRGKNMPEKKEAFGMELKRLREEKRIGQAKLAQELGMSPRSGAYISAWETGRRRPSRKWLSKLTQVFPTLTLPPDPTPKRKVPFQRSNTVEVRSEGGRLRIEVNCEINEARRFLEFVLAGLDLK